MGFSKYFLLPLFSGFQFSFKTQSLIFYRSTNSYFIAIVKIMFLINSPLQKHFKERYIFSVFCSRSVFCSNVAGFKSQILLLFWAYMGVL